MIGALIGAFFAGAAVGTLVMIFNFASSSRTREIDFQLRQPRFNWRPPTEKPDGHRTYLVQLRDGSYIVAHYSDLVISGGYLPGCWWVWNGGEQTPVMPLKWTEIKDGEIVYYLEQRE